MEVFLNNVRELAVYTLLPWEYRKAMEPDLRWVPAYEPRDVMEHIQTMLGYVPLGEVIYTNGLSIPDTRLMPVDYVALYAASLKASSEYSKRAYGELVAFTLIHELGHAITGEGHNSERWASVCRQMGIAEKRYELKGPDGGGKFLFLNQVLLAAIRALGSYPGDTLL